MIPESARVHFVGIGGSGMSAIAEVLLRRGYRVSGCDLDDSPATRRLRALGAPVTLGHSPAHLVDADLVIYSRAVGGENDEVRAARARGLTVLHRADALAAVMRAGRSIAVVGTHGKTTTAAMLTRILVAAGLDPTALIGADVPELGGNARVGRGAWVVAEVDESDGSLLRIAPTAAVLTSLDATDHRDFYASSAQLIGTFEQFLCGVAPDGFIAACADHPGAAALARDLGRSVITYGLGDDAMVRGEVRTIEGCHVRATIWLERRAAGDLVLQVPGRHNVSNALGALAASVAAGVPVETALEALAGFRGVSRRFEVRGEADGVLVVDDYAHNPVKVAAVLRAAREGWPQHRLVVVFQPHRYSRTRTTFAEFERAFDAADEVVVTEVYGAGEDPVPGVGARLIVDAVASRRPVHYRPTTEEAVDLVERLAGPGTMVLTLGAGDIGRAGDLLLQRLVARARAGQGPGGGDSARGIR